MRFFVFSSSFHCEKGAWGRTTPPPDKLKENLAPKISYIRRSWMIHLIPKETCPFQKLQICKNEGQSAPFDSWSQITYAFEQLALLPVSLIGAILSHVPARDNLASPPDPPHIYLLLFGLDHHPCKKDDTCVKKVNLQHRLSAGISNLERVGKGRIKLCSAIWCISSQWKEKSCFL